MIAARELHDKPEELTALSNYIETFSSYGQHIETLEELVKHLHILARNVEMKGHAVYDYFRALHFYHAVGKNDFATALKICRSMHDQKSELAPWQVMLNQVFMADCLIQQGDLLAGQKLYQEARGIAQRINFQRASVFIPLRLAQNALKQRDVLRAQSFLDETRTNLRRFSDKRFAADIQYQYAHLHLLCADLPAAHTALTEAIDLFERMGMRRELAEAREELARLEAQMAEESREPRTEN
jgi:hypothetical protein